LPLGISFTDAAITLVAVVFHELACRTQTCAIIIIIIIIAVVVVVNLRERGS